jgi:hypothetical protein
MEEPQVTFLDMVKKASGIIGFHRTCNHYAPYPLLQEGPQQIHDGFSKIVGAFFVFSVEFYGSIMSNYFAEYLPQDGSFLF